MGTQVDYLASLTSIAERYNHLSRQQIFEKFTNEFERFEAFLRQHYAYDVFNEDDLISVFCDTLLRLLYQMTDVTSKHDENIVRRKDEEYGGSWQKRGGQGAFMMLCRKYDRIVHQVSLCENDFVKATSRDDRDEGIADDFSDLRCYLLLVASYRLSHNLKKYVRDEVHF